MCFTVKCTISWPVPTIYVQANNGQNLCDITPHIQQHELKFKGVGALLGVFPKIDFDIKHGKMHPWPFH